MTNLRDLNRAVQRAEFPSHDFAQAVREALNEVTERMEPASEGAKVECPNCLQKVPSELEHWHSGYHDDNYTVEPHYTCEPAQPELVPSNGERRLAPEPAAPGEMAEARMAIAAARKYAAELDHPTSAEFHIRVDGFVAGAKFAHTHAQPEPKLECPNCRKGVNRSTDHCSMDQGPHGPLDYDCKPAQPEPAAPGEMPFEISNTLHRLRTSAYPSDSIVADALESWYRTHAQPVGMADELGRVLSTLHILAGEMGTNVGNGVRSDIAAVRAQYGEGRKR